MKLKEKFYEIKKEKEQLDKVTNYLGSKNLDDLKQYNDLKNQYKDIMRDKEKL